MRQSGSLDSELLGAYIAGEATPVQIAEIELWASGHPRREQLLSNLRGGQKIGRPVTHKANLNAIAMVVENHALASNANNTVSRNPFKRAILGVAALGVCLLLGVQYIPKIIDAGKPAARSYTYTTKPGQRAKITLASGAQVTLAPATTLNAIGSEISLDGHAVFTVLHNGKTPFIVRTREAAVRVLGTTFSVRSYKEDMSTKVIVAEGKVSANNTVLAVGDAADVTASNTKLSHSTDITNAFAWTEGRLVFNEAPLAQVAVELERWYGVTISIPDSARPWLITGTFSQSTLGAKDLDFIAEFVGLHYKRSGNHITFFRR